MLQKGFIMKTTKKTKKKKKNTYIKNSIVRVVVGGSLVVFGFGCFFYPNFREWRTQNDVNQIIEEFDKNYEQGISNEITSDDDIDVVIDTDSADSADSADDEIEKDSDKTNGQYTRPYQALYDMLTDYNENLASNGQKIESAWSDGQHPIDLSAYANISGNSSTIGYIEIPDMKIRLPLMLGASDANLEKGAAVLNETSMPVGGEDTNCVISAHRGWDGSAYFQYVENMKTGSKVYITNPWETLVYECVNTKVIYPDDVESLKIQPGKDMVTLYTCHPYMIGGGPYRYLVFCERVGTQERLEAEGVENPKVDEEDMQSDEQQVDLPAEVDTTTEAEKETVDETTIRKEEEILYETANGLDLLALEQTLRIMLPITMFASVVVIILLRKYKKNKKHERKNKKNKYKI